MKVAAYHDEWYPFFFLTTDKENWFYKNDTDAFIDMSKEEYASYLNFMELLEHWQSFIENRISEVIK